jgi:small GTP-binding protein
MRKKRILLVEDEASVAFLMKEHLTSLGPEYEVASACCGEEALEQMECGEWDLVVTDLCMPGITGIELIEKLKQKKPATLTILITAYGSDEVKQAAQRLNVYYYMTKPFPLADLSRVIKDALSLKQCDDANGGAAGSPTEKGEMQAVKVMLAGDGAVGKTALIYRLCTERFNAKRTMTIGVEFHIYDVRYIPSTTRMIVWDVGGQDRFAFTRRAFYRGSRAVGLVYDVSCRKTFERLERWNTEIREMLPTVSLVLAGNKTDLPREVSREEGQAMARAWCAPFFETSCVTGEGVRAFFCAIADATAKYVRP